MSAGEVAGHVALHRRSADAVMAVAAEALGRSPDRLAVVARLLVAPDHRRHGVGATLREAAAGEAARRGRHAVPDVVPRLGAAVALSDARGWRRLGQVVTPLPDGTGIGELVFAAPPLAPPAGRGPATVVDGRVEGDVERETEKP